MSKLYTIDEVAKILRVDAQTVRKMMDADVLKKYEHWFYVGRLVRIKETAVKQVMHELSQ